MKLTFDDVATATSAYRSGNVPRQNVRRGGRQAGGTAVARDRRWAPISCPRFLSYVSLFNEKASTRKKYKEPRQDSRPISSLVFLTLVVVLPRVPQRVFYVFSKLGEDATSLFHHAPRPPPPRVLIARLRDLHISVVWTSLLQGFSETPLVSTSGRSKLDRRQATHS